MPTTLYLLTMQQPFHNLLILVAQLVTLVVIRCQCIFQTSSQTSGRSNSCGTEQDLDQPLLQMACIGLIEKADNLTGYPVLYTSAVPEFVHPLQDCLFRREDGNFQRLAQPPD